MSTTSLSLLERARRNRDSDAWRRLAELYTPLLKQWLGRYALQPSDTDDLVQEVLLTVARELPRFEHAGRPGAFRSWLRGILVFRLKNYWRAQQRSPQGRGDTGFLRRLHELEDPHTQLSRFWDEEHDHYVLQRLLEIVAGRFEPETMEAFRRVVLQREKVETVARDLSLSVNAIAIAKCRVTKELRREASGLLDL